MAVGWIWALALASAAPPTTWEDTWARGLEPVEARSITPATGTLVLRGATVLTAAGDRFEPGYVLVRDGRIAEVGAGDGPDADEVRRLDGMFLTPGIIDTHSHLGVYPSPGAAAHRDGNEMVAPTTPGVWAEHATWPEDPGFERAVAGGITTLQILPGSGNLIGGRGVVLRPVPGRGARAMRFPGAPETLKMACGENPKRVYGEHGGPMTRMGNLYRQREAFLAAERYRADWDAAAPVEGKKKRGAPATPTPPKVDLNHETLAGALRGEVLVQVHCYRADDMVALLQLADEFGFSVRSFHHAVEAYKIRDLLADRGVAVSTWSDWWGFKMEAYDAVLPNAALLTEAGVRAVIHSDSEIGIQRLNQEAGKAWYDGLDAGINLTEDDALRWITANPAWVLGIDGETGTLEAGKRADLVAWTAHPLRIAAQAALVLIDGQVVWDHNAPAIWSDFVRGQEVGR